MPVKITNPSVSGGTDHGSPFVGPIMHTAQISALLTGYTSAEIDSQGYLKPGVPVLSTGLLVSGAAQTIFGVTIEAIKVGNGNAAGDLAALGTQQIVVATIGQVNKKIIEDNLGRVLSANELAAFAIGGCTVKLLS